MGYRHTKQHEQKVKKAKNIVRIEIRCMEGKVQALKKKYDIDKENTLYAW